MRGFLCALRRFQKQSKIYFSQLQPSIASDNLTMLRRGSAAFALFLVLYGVIMVPMMRSPGLILYYIAFLILDLPLLVFVRRYGQARPASFPVVQGLSHFVVWLLLGFVILISVFPFPTQPGIFFPLGYMLVTVLFVFPYWQMFLSLTAATALYLTLVFCFKSPNAIAYDTACAITTWLLGFFFIFCIADLRLKNGMTRLALEEIGRIDQLTGLLNRHVLDQETDTRFRRCQLARQPVAVFMIDVDNFKAYNDAYGHPAGDECLQRIAAVLKACSEELGALAIRFGGEEFMLFLSSCPPQEAAQLADKLLERVRGLSIPVSGGGTVSISVGGTVVIPDERDTLAQLISQADAALYRAKQAGRDQVVFWSPEACSHE